VINFKKYSTILFILLFLNSGVSLLAWDSSKFGPVLRLYLAPVGIGTSVIPYEEESDGLIPGYRSVAGDPAARSYTGYSLSAGFYYSSFQAEMSFSKKNLRNQKILGDLYSGDLNNFDIKTGYRFDYPGDTSYGFLYLSFKTLSYSIPFNNTSADGLGIVAGYYGFHSYGFNSSMEIAFSYEFYLGKYFKNDISSSVINEPEFIMSYTLGGSIGAGVQYEPCNLTFLLKAAPEVNYIGYNNGLQGGYDSGAGAFGISMGIEVIYAMPLSKIVSGKE